MSTYLEGIIEGAPSCQTTWDNGQGFVLSEVLLRVTVTRAACRGRAPVLLVTAALNIPAALPAILFCLNLTLISILPGCSK